LNPSKVASVTPFDDVQARLDRIEQERKVRQPLKAVTA
jgi:hypothetical protein